MRPTPNCEALATSSIFMENPARFAISPILGMRELLLSTTTGVGTIHSNFGTPKFKSYLPKVHLLESVSDGTDQIEKSKSTPLKSLKTKPTPLLYFVPLIVTESCINSTAFRLISCPAILTLPLCVKLSKAKVLPAVMLAWLILKPLSCNFGNSKSNKFTPKASLMAFKTLASTYSANACELTLSCASILSFARRSHLLSVFLNISILEPLLIPMLAFQKLILASAGVVRL